MTLLRQRMIEDMQVRNLAPHTQATYVLHVSLFARHFRKSPELLGPEEIRDYQLYLTNQRKLEPSSLVVTTAALRFLYNVTLKRGWNLEASIPAPRQPKKLPVVLSRAEVLHFLGCVEDIKHQAILTTCYAAGLRISEAVRLKTSSLDNQRMVIRVAQGKGRKAALADKAIRPADGFEVCGAGDVIGKELLELGKRAGEWEIVGVEHGPSFLARILHDVRVCVNRISMVRSSRSVTISPWSILLNIIASGSLSTQIRRAGHGDTAN